MKPCFLIILCAYGLMGCIGGGTHGSVKGYGYPVNKYKLESALNAVFLSNKNILEKDTARDYYNDDTNYVTFHIVKGEINNYYTIKFGGNKPYWDSSKISSLFIAYAHDKESKGGSEGNGGVKWYNLTLKKNLTEPFEREVVDKIDNALGVKHREE